MSERLRVLLVEDDLSIAEATEVKLSPRFEVRVAHELEEALAMVDQWTPDVIVSDYYLGIFTAKDLFLRIEREHPKIRRIVYSDADPEEYEFLIQRRLASQAVWKWDRFGKLVEAIETPDEEVVT